MPAILGIDAAWTRTEPSGVALLSGEGATWKCVAVAPSYASFIAATEGVSVDWSSRPTPGQPDVHALLTASRVLLNGMSVDVVAIDVPLATGGITGRRVADDAISRAFGARGCAVHTPNPHRPGPIADLFYRELAAGGYPLATTATAQGLAPALIEVFPHTALLALLDAAYRVRYKISRAARYWPLLSAADRRANILTEWRRILDALGRIIGAIPLQLPNPNTKIDLKRFEDALDALICGWVGITYLARGAVSYGDATAAIWTPK